MSGRLFPVGAVPVQVVNKAGVVIDTVPIVLSEYESELLSIVLGTVRHFDELKATTVRAAGGWVRDKVSCALYFVRFSYSWYRHGVVEPAWLTAPCRARVVSVLSLGTRAFSCERVFARCSVCTGAAAVRLALSTAGVALVCVIADARVPCRRSMRSASADHGPGQS